MENAAFIFVQKRMSTRIFVNTYPNNTLIKYTKVATPLLAH